MGLHGAAGMTICYMPPEILDDPNAEATAKADTYAHALLVFELVTGQLPSKANRVKLLGPKAIAVVTSVEEQLLRSMHQISGQLWKLRVRIEATFTAEDNTRLRRELDALKALSMKIEQRTIKALGRAEDPPPADDSNGGPASPIDNSQPFSVRTQPQPWLSMPTQQWLVAHSATLSILSSAVALTDVPSLGEEELFLSFLRSRKIPHDVCEAVQKIGVDGPAFADASLMIECEPLLLAEGIKNYATVTAEAAYRVPECRQLRCSVLNVCVRTRGSFCFSSNLKKALSTTKNDNSHLLYRFLRLKQVRQVGCHHLSYAFYPLSLLSQPLPFRSL